MNSEEEIEQDELNLHECMSPLMKLLDRMEHNKINPEVPSLCIITLFIIAYSHPQTYLIPCRGGRGESQVYTSPHLFTEPTGV